MSNVQILPSLGKTVLFTPSAYVDISQPRVQTDTSGKCAAIITSVHSASMVNLTVFDCNGYPMPMQSVPLLQHGEALRKEGRYCEWPPDVVSQAHLRASVGQCGGQVTKTPS